MLKKKVDGKLEEFNMEHIERADMFRDKVNLLDVYGHIVFFSIGEEK